MLLCWWSRKCIQCISQHVELSLLTAKWLLTLSCFGNTARVQLGLHPLIFVLTQTQSNTAAPKKLLAARSKHSHPRSSLHVHDERNESIQPATKEGSPSCLDRGHVSQRQQASAAATSLWNHRCDDGSRPPDSTGNGDSGGWRMSLVKYGPVRGERGWAQRHRAVAPRGWLHHWHSPWSRWRDGRVGGGPD